MSRSLRPLDSITHHRRVQAWNIRLYCYLCIVLVGLQYRWATSSGCCLILAQRESRICTSMYSSGLFLISSGTISWNMHHGEPTTCIKFINFHKKSRQNLRQQICRKVLFKSIQLDLDQNQGWLGCVGTKWCDEFGITNFSLALSGWATSFEFRSHRVNEAIIVFGLDEYSTHWQQNA